MPSRKVPTDDRPASSPTESPSQVKNRRTAHGQKETKRALGPGMAMDTGDAIADPAVLQGKVSTEHGTPGGPSVKSDEPAAEEADTHSTSKKEKE